MSEGRRVVLLVAVAIVVLGGRESLAGQGWWVEASAGGVSLEAVADRAAETSAVLGVRRQGTSWWYASVGMPLDTAGIAWGVTGAGSRVERRSRIGGGYGFEVAGHGLLYRSGELDATGRGWVGELAPFAAVEHGAARIEARAAWEGYGSGFQDERFTRALYSTGMRLSYEPLPGLEAAGRARYAWGSEGAYPFLGAGGELSGGPGSVWLRGGRWLTDSIPTPEWELGGQLRVGSRARLTAGLRQSTNDPLFWNEPRRSWSVGVLVGVGAARAALPSAPVAEMRGAQVVLRIPREAVGERPQVAGDFTGWELVEMTREGDHWVAYLHIAPGVYRYAFRRADGSWFVPASIPHRVDDGFGGENAVLVVP